MFSRTHAGPVINDPWNDAFSSVSGTVPLALQWVSIMPGVPDTTMDAFTQINFAHNYSEFRAALRAYVAPAQNFIFADTAGNIGCARGAAVRVGAVCVMLGAAPDTNSLGVCRCARLVTRGRGRCLATAGACAGCARGRYVLLLLHCCRLTIASHTASGGEAGCRSRSSCTRTTRRRVS